MNIPDHYLTIKPILDLSLFGIENTEKYLSENEKIVFSKEFLTYQSEFLSNEAPGENDILLKTCVCYLRNLDKHAREDIVKVLLENKPVADALMMLTRLELGLLDPEQYTANFEGELNDYIEKNKVTPSLFLFLQKHFLNFERINPANYKNFELTRTEYTDLISDYLNVQSNLS
jgi:hypothetical protein